MLSRAAKTALGRPLITSRLAVQSTIVPAQSRAYGSDHHHDDHHHDDKGFKRPVPKPKHIEEYLKVAREWPHERMHPDHYLHSFQLKKLGDNYGHVSEHPTGHESYNTPPTFATPFWTKMFLGAISVTVLYRLNQSYAADKPIHPLTEWMKPYLDAADNDQLREERLARNFEEKWRRADDRAILMEALPPPIRYTVPGQFFRRSDWLVEPGTQVDVSDIEKIMKHDWQTDDELFGPPHPRHLKDPKYQ
ncbi:hypothetical protein HK097_007318 [Rhizophlyctis rosea]|uniref:Uncharacterized protein n=1 Tax=Rhizophlyctis rosea TaxID=64517 RepID=A0AAD5SJG0_9FUNG|nr:hypothetical protein HK097_007318 [Rhizophlyctis rosea]